ncbi:Cilia- and flagella-associated protein 57 [Phlyctochytrium bullatum]|nr:Cilia- and flagella-associated protein 57 [Phlyctochytrium bullatum]
MIVAIGRGFLVGGVGGAVEVFERLVDSASGNREYYKMMWRLPLPEESMVVRSMAVSGSEGGLIVLLETNSLLKIPLTWSDFIKGEEVKFEQLFQPYHHGTVTGLDLCCRKPILVTCSSDRSIRVWNYATGTCELSKYFPEEAYSVSLHPSGLYLLVGFSDKLRLLNVLMDDFRLFKEFGIRGCREEINESTVTCQVETNVVLTQIALSHNGKMMFAGTSSGQIRSLKFPLTGDPEDFQEHQAHSGSISKLRISYDDQYLFSVAEDGCIYVYKISDKDERTMKRDRSLQFADEILITKSDLEEKTVMMSELQRSLEELKLEHEYQLRLKDMNFNEKLKELTEKYSQEIEALKISTSVLRTEKDKEEVKHEEELQSIKAKHMHELHEMETKYNQQLMEEYEKFQDLQANAGQMQDQWQKQMKDFEGATQRSLSDAQAEAEARLNMKSAEIARLHDETHQQLAEFEEMARQNNEDIDSEIQILSARYEKKLRAEREEGARLKGENGIMRKKFNTLNKDIEDNRNEIQRMKEEEKKFRGVIAVLEKDIATLKKDMAERDELIQDKERRVYDLKKKNQELEKFKFVLDFRIKELKEQVEPRENNIQEMSTQIRDINFELEILNKQKGLLEEEILDLTTKLEVTKKDYAREHRRLHDITHYLKVFRNELQDAVQYIQEPALLKKCIENLHRKYCTGMTDLSNSGIDKDVKREYLRQHELLKEQVSELRTMAEQNMNAYRADNVHSMIENQLLIGEINALRKATKGKLNKIKAVESTSEAAILQVISSKPKTPGQLHKGIGLPELRAPPGLPPVPFFKAAVVSPAK